MNTRKTEKVVNNHLFNKNILATAVAAVMVGSTGAALAVTNINDAQSVTGDLTTNYNIDNAGTLTITGGTSTTSYLSSFNGTIDGGLQPNEGNVVIAGNLTMRGNIGSTNTTGNFTLSDGNTLVLQDSMTTFTSSNLTLSSNSILNFGNATSGYNRDTSLIMNANITMAGNSTINIANGVTLIGDVYGTSSGKGTVNIFGNFTSGGSFGALQELGKDNATEALEQINVIKGNTFTLNHNATATRMDINGTVTASGNITSTISMGTSAILNLNTEDDGGTTAAKVVGTINGLAARGGTLNINGTFTTQGVIGGTYGLTAINIDTGLNATSVNTHTVTLAHDVNATTITLGGANSQKNATLQTAAGVNIVITGSIAGGGNSTSALNLSGGRFLSQGNTTVNGNIGSSGARLADIRIEDGTTLSITGASRNIYANNITMMPVGQSLSNNLNATIAFNGTGTANVYGVIAGGSNNGGEGLVEINSGTVVFNNTIGSASNYISGITVASNATLRTSSNIYANETISIKGGTLDIDNVSGITITANSAGISTFGLRVGDGSYDNGTLETKGTLTLASSTKAIAQTGVEHQFNNATIKLNGTHSAHSTIDTAYIDIGSNNQTVRVQGNTTIDLDLTNTVITDGATIVIIGRGSTNGNNGTLNISGNVSATGYHMFKIAFNNSTAFSAGSSSNYLGTESLNATVTYKSSSELGMTGNTLNTYNSAKTAIAADTTVFQALAGMTTDTALKNAIATMHPATGGAEAASASISGSSMSTAGTRMAYTRQTGLGKGMNAGGATLDESMWVQIFGANVDQDNVSGVSGYDADGQGLAIGIDGLSADGTTRIGIAGSFANTDVTGKDSTTKTTTDIDTTQVMVYANKDYADGMYVEGVASYAFNDNTGTRRILVGAVDRTASSAYDSGVFAVNVEAGWPKENNGVTITPTLGIAYSHLSSDAYTETGAAGMNLTVTPGDVSTFEGKAGVKITGKSVDADGGIGRPEIRIGVTHNLGDKTADSTATFTAGGSSFTTKGVETDTTKLDLGLGYTYTTPEGDTEISVNADGRQSDSYLQYGGGLTVKWKF